MTIIQLKCIGLVNGIAVSDEVKAKGEETEARRRESRGGPKGVQAVVLYWSM
jgi:L-aminopeptidase/D-esterase-like protein